MAPNDNKPDYSKIKTPGGVTTTPDGTTHPTSVTDDSRAAQVQALKNERELLKGRANDADDPVAKRRIREIDDSLEGFGERPSRARKETVTPPTSTPPVPPAS